MHRQRGGKFLGGTLHEAVHHRTDRGAIFQEALAPLAVAADCDFFHHGAGQVRKAAHLREQRLCFEERMAGGHDRRFHGVHAREQDFAHQPHIGLGDQRVAGLAGHHQGQPQRFPGPLQPVHRHHGDEGRDIGIAADQRVIAFAQLPENVLGQMHQ